MKYRCNSWRFQLKSLLLLSLTIAAFGAARAGAEEMQYPLSAIVGGDGMLYVADRNLPGIWKIEDGTPAPYFTGSKQFRTPLNAVRCLAIDHEGKLLAGDTSTRQVYRMDNADEPHPLLTNKTGLGIPMSVVAGPDGTLFVADLETHRIWTVPASGGEPAEFVQVPAPRGLAMDAEGNLWVVSHGENQLLRVSSEGQIEPIVRGRPFQFPHNVVLDEEGVAYISDGYAKTIWKVDRAGEPRAWMSGEPLVNPVGLAWRGEQLLIVDPHARTVFAADTEGKLSRVVSGMTTSN